MQGEGCQPQSRASVKLPFIQAYCTVPYTAESLQSCCNCRAFCTVFTIDAMLVRHETLHSIRSSESILTTASCLRLTRSHETGIVSAGCVVLYSARLLLHPRDQVFRLQLYSIVRADRTLSIIASFRRVARYYSNCLLNERRGPVFFLMYCKLFLATINITTTNNNKNKQQMKHYCFLFI